MCVESIPWEKIKSPNHVSFYFLFFKKTPLSGSLLAKVFLLALLNESKSAVCVTKGLKEGRWRGGRKDKRKAVIKEPRDKESLLSQALCYNHLASDLPSWVHPPHLRSVKNSSD